MGKARVPGRTGGKRVGAGGALSWRMAWRNVLRHRRRSLATGAAIALGFAGVVLLGGYMLRMESYLSTQAIYLDHAGLVSVYRAGGQGRELADPEQANLSEQDQRNIEAAAAALGTGPRFMGRYLKGQGLVSNGCRSYPFLATAVEPETEARIRSHPEVLRWIPELARIRRGAGLWAPGAPADGIMITPVMARMLDKPLVAGDPGEDPKAMDRLITDCSAADASRVISSHSGLQLVGTTFSRGLAAADARISGIFTTGLALSEDSAVILPLSLAQRFYDTDRVTWIALYFAPGVRAGRIKSELERIFAAHGWRYDVYRYDDARISPFYVGAMGFVDVMTAFFLALVCGVVVLSVVNSLQISFYERKSEVGTLRAIGFRPSAVSSLFLRETALLVALALAGGAALAWGAAAVVNRMNFRFNIVGSAEKLQFLLKPGAIFVGATGLLFLAVCALATWLACRRWARTSIVSLLEEA